MSLSNAYQEHGQHSDQSSILFEGEAYAKVTPWRRIDEWCRFPRECAASTPQGALESNQRAPVVLRAAQANCRFVDPSGLAVEGR